MAARILEAGGIGGHLEVAAVGLDLHVQGIELGAM